MRRQPQRRKPRKDRRFKCALQTSVSLGGSCPHLSAQKETSKQYKILPPSSSSPTPLVCPSTCLLPLPGRATAPRTTPAVNKIKYTWRTPPEGERGEHWISPTASCDGRSAATWRALGPKRSASDRPDQQWWCRVPSETGNGEVLCTDPSNSLAAQNATAPVETTHRPLCGRPCQLHSRAMMVAFAPSVAHLPSGPSPGN